jgi:hypothetical protein
MNKIPIEEIPVKAGQEYIHYKGGLYLVIGVGKHTETEEDMVIYRCYGDVQPLWIRPLKMFTNRVEIGDEHGQVHEVQRFTLIADINEMSYGEEE